MIKGILSFISVLFIASISQAVLPDSTPDIDHLENATRAKETAPAATAQDANDSAVPGAIPGMEYLGDKGLKEDLGPETGRIDQNKSHSDISSLLAPEISESNFSQFFVVQAGAFNPKFIATSNGDYNFRYSDDSLNTYLVQIGWAQRLLSFLGAWHFEENLGYAGITATGTSAVQGQNSVRTLHLNLMSLDSRIMYSMEWFPWKVLIPFVDGGYQYTFYNQTGNSDLEATQGGVGQFTEGIGVRIWVNKFTFTNSDFVSKFGSLPIFLTAKASWILPNSQSIDLSSQTYLLGLAIGL